VISAEFLAEARDPQSLPPAGPPEIAIAGRSNVGKSTLLNRLAGRRSLARTSKTPGRTRGIVFFDLTVGLPAASVGEVRQRKALRLVDLPGYGYARVAQAERRAWQPLVEGYTTGRSTLILFLVLVDMRRGPEEEERQLLEWLDVSGVPHRIILTKADKVGRKERSALARRFPGALPVSGETGEGIDELWGIILRRLGDRGGADGGAGIATRDTGA
jgi:GTP-binding protein